MLQPISIRQFPSAFAQNDPAYSHLNAAATQPLKTGERVITVEVDAVLANATKLSAMLIDADTAPGNSLAKLALVFAAAARFERVPGESLHDFGLRLASFIDAMKPQDLVLAERLSGLRLLGISAKSLAEALRNPGSVTAARIIAQAEFPGMKAGNGAARTVIDTYQQNEISEPLLPARTNANAARPGLSSPAAVPLPATGMALAENVRSPSQPSTVNTAVTGTSPTTTRSILVPEQEALLQPSLQLTTTVTEIISGTSPDQVPEMRTEANWDSSSLPAHMTDVDPQQADLAKADTRFLDRRMERYQDRRMETMRVLRGFSEVVSVLDRKDAAQVKALVGSMLPTPAEALRFLPTLAGTELALAFKALAKVDFLTAQTREEEPVPEAMTDTDAAIGMREETDEDGVYDRADLQSPGKAKSDSANEMTGPREMPVLRQGDAVPAYMLAYPIANGSKAEKTRARARSEDKACAEEDEAGEERGRNEGQDDRKRDDAFEAATDNDNPFEPETPLSRRPTDAERAFHMYRNMGGF